MFIHCTLRYEKHLNMLSAVFRRHGLIQTCLSLTTTGIPVRRLKRGQNEAPEKVPPNWRSSLRDTYNHTECLAHQNVTLCLEDVAIVTRGEHVFRESGGFQSFETMKRWTAESFCNQHACFSRCFEKNGGLISLLLLENPVSSFSYTPWL